MRNTNEYEAFVNATKSEAPRTDKSNDDSLNPFEDMMDAAVNDSTKRIPFDELCEQLYFTQIAPSNDVSDTNFVRSMFFKFVEIFDGTYQVPYSVYALHAKLPATNRLICHGALVDTGAQKSVIGFVQAKAYMLAMSGRICELLPSKSRFRLGSGVVSAIGAGHVSISTPKRSIEETNDVVPCDIPFVFGLNIMDRHGLQALTAYNVLECIPEKWFAPLMRKSGQVYFDCTKYVNSPGVRNFYTKEELKKLHRHFTHPSARKLYDLLKRAIDAPLPPNTFSTIDEIVKECDTCIEMTPRANSFQFQAPDKVVFNHRLLLDIVYLPTDKRKKGPVLHIIDAGTRFNAAAFLAKLDTTYIRNAFIKTWARMYIGTPSSILVNQGSVFVSYEWKMHVN